MSEDKLQDCHLINNVMFMIKIDWKDNVFPKEIPNDCQLCHSDRLILHKMLADKADEIESLHQTGFLFKYLKQASEDSEWASIYRGLSCVSHCFAFERETCVKTFSLVQTDRSGCFQQQCLS